MAEEREIKYVNREFNDFRTQLIEYTKNYFPDTYNDFSATSPGMLFIEMASYVGDILSFYQDYQLQETFLTYAKDPKNLYSLAYMMGYRPKTTGVSTANLEITQNIQADPTSNYFPSWSQAAIIPENLIISSTDNSQTKFLLNQRVDLTVSSSYSPTEVVINTLDGSNNPETYLIKKSVEVFSSEIVETTFNITSTDKFKTLVIEDTDIVGILDIYEGDNQTGDRWYEVPFLGQDTVYTDVENTSTNPELTPRTLTVTRAPRRFASRHLSSGFLQLQFGAGTNIGDDSEILPDPYNVGLGNDPTYSQLNKAYDPSNFLYSKSYGVAPTAGTILYVRYLKGGGISANVPANTITSPNSSPGIVDQENNTTRTTAEFLTFNNPQPAEGGRDGDTIEELRENSLRAFGEQSRAVTLQDYSIRALSLPPKYGSIAKAYVTQETLNNNESLDVYNPLALSLYVLAYDNNSKLTTTSNTLKHNLKTYLADFIPISDSINIKDAFIINIGVDYDVIVKPNYSGRDVLLKCSNILKEHFSIKKRNINQPINLAKVYTLLDSIKGVQTVQKVEITNKRGGNYSQYAYDIKGATKNNVVYPSFDPCIFEVKFPDQDIKGRVTVL